MDRRRPGHRFGLWALWRLPRRSRSACVPMLPSAPRTPLRGPRTRQTSTSPTARRTPCISGPRPRAATSAGTTPATRTSLSSRGKRPGDGRGLKSAISIATSPSGSRSSGRQGSTCSSRASRSIRDLPRTRSPLSPSGSRTGLETRRGSGRRGGTGRCPRSQWAWT